MEEEAKVEDDAGFPEPSRDLGVALDKLTSIVELLTGNKKKKATLSSSKLDAALDNVSLGASGSGKKSRRALRNAFQDHPEESTRAATPGSFCQSLDRVSIENQCLESLRSLSIWIL